MSVCLLSSCDRLVRTNYVRHVADNEAGFFMWDGITVNYDSITVGCMEGKKLGFSWFDFHGDDTMETYDCNAFAHQFENCLEARRLGDKDSIRYECFNHTEHRGRIWG